MSETRAIATPFALDSLREDLSSLQIQAYKSSIENREINPSEIPPGIKTVLQSTMVKLLNETIREGKFKDIAQNENLRNYFNHFYAVLNGAQMMAQNVLSGQAIPKPSSKARYGTYIIEALGKASSLPVISYALQAAGALILQIDKSQQATKLGKFLSLLPSDPSSWEKELSAQVLYIVLDDEKIAEIVEQKIPVFDKLKRYCTGRFQPSDYPAALGIHDGLKGVEAILNGQISDLSMISSFIIGKKALSETIAIDIDSLREYFSQTDKVASENFKFITSHNFASARFASASDGASNISSETPKGASQENGLATSDGIEAKNGGKNINSATQVGGRTINKIHTAGDLIAKGPGSANIRSTTKSTILFQEREDLRRQEGAQAQEGSSRS